MIIIDQQRPQGGGDAFAAVKTQLGGPDVTSHHREHGHGDVPRFLGPMAGGPDREAALGDVPEHSDDETGPAQEPADIFRADTAAALVAYVASGAHADQIVTCGEAAQHVSAQGNPACQAPVGLPWALTCW